MNEYISSELKGKYKAEKLIIPTYKSPKKFYIAEDLSNFDQLSFALGEVNDHEAYITEKGFLFFKEIGLNKIGKILFDNQWYSQDFKSPEDIAEWFKSFNDFPKTE